MGVFEAIASDTHEEVLYGHDPISGLKAIIAMVGPPTYPAPMQSMCLSKVIDAPTSRSKRYCSWGLIRTFIQSFSKGVDTIRKPSGPSVKPS